MMTDRQRRDDFRVAAVCGDEARTYDVAGLNGRRPLLEIKRFASHGAALQFAQDYDDKQRGRSNVR